MAFEKAETAAARAPGSLDGLLRLAADDMAGVNAFIAARMQSPVAIIPALADHLINAGGKRLRPLVTIAGARLAGATDDACQKLAAAIEFIHTATLLHDDVVDASELRRGKVAAHLIWGGTQSVLVGDYLFARAFELIVEASSLKALEILARASRVIAEGEVLQLMNMHDADLAVEDYLRVIRYKTAKLFEASARLGAVIADAPREIEDACANFGRSLGTAFQLVDDLLDYEGDTASLGKNVGDDLREGKPTLPLLYAMSHGTPEEAALIRHAIEQGEVERLAEIVQIVRRTGAIDATRQAARREADHAREQLAALPDSETKQLLLDLCVRSVERSS